MSCVNDNFTFIYLSILIHIILLQLGKLQYNIGKQSTIYDSLLHKRL